ncbi:MAG TPA: ureidoglycolate lyase [Acidimicrobiia bacterium]|nr:ureidoglycolate lyase [Acidimicrobiia bacterium]
MREVRAIELVAEPLTPLRWAPFGTVVSEEGTEHDRAALEFAWDDGAVNFIAHDRDEIPRDADGVMVCDHLNRHDTHTQTLMPVDQPALLVVAPADVGFAAGEDVEAVRAFLLEPLQAVHLFRGTWHWGPFPVEAPRVRIFNVQGRGYPRDNTVSDLGARLGVRFRVLAAPS